MPDAPGPQAQPTPVTTTLAAVTTPVIDATPTADAVAAAALAAAAATTTTPAPTTSAVTTPAPAGSDGAVVPAPVIPDVYALKLPDQSTLTEADLASFSVEAKHLKLTAEQAQTLVDVRSRHMDETAAQYLVELKADPELGGARFDENVQLALKGRDVLFPPNSAEAALVNGWFATGLGNHKALVRAFARLGRMVSEDAPGTLRSGAADTRTAAERLYPTMAR